jgi:hypothetical protein
MTSSNNSRERVDLARSFCCDIFPVGRPVVVAIHKSGNHTSGNPAVRFRYYPQSAPGHFSRRVSGNWLARVMRHSSVRAPLASSFFPETGGTFLRGLLNFCRALPGWSTGFLRTLAQPRKQSSGVFTVFTCPHPFVGAVRLHARNKSMEMEAWRAEKRSIRSVK